MCIIINFKGILEISIINISKNHEKYIKDRTINIFEGDGKFGLNDYSPYDCIHIGASTTFDVVELLMKQLNIGGVLFAPVELNQINQFIYVFEKKSENQIEKTQLMQVVSFISLT